MTVAYMQGVTVPVVRSTDVAEARRTAARIADGLGFGEVESGRLAIVVSEIATNLIKHGGGGYVFVQPLDSCGRGGVEILAIDRGNGIADVSRSMRDGFSTAGSSGTGLGAIRRLSASFDIYTAHGMGTAVVARLWPGQGDVPRPDHIAVGGVVLAREGEETAGDRWACLRGRDCCAIIIADGLGHGPLAAEAAVAAVESFRRHPDATPADQIAAAHIALRPTRGAAVGVARIDHRRKCVDFSGIGNITCVVFGGESSHSFVSLNGIVGHSVRQVKAFEHVWPSRGLLLMYSDGLSSHWSLDPYPGLASVDPALIAGVLCRDFRRTYDDATVVAAAEKAHSQRDGG